MKNKEGTIIKDKNQNLDTWSDYVEEHWNDARDEQFDVKYDIEGTSILKMEVQNALRYIKSGKSPGPDTTTEPISSLEECGIDQIISFWT